VKALGIDATGEVFYTIKQPSASTADLSRDLRTVMHISSTVQVLDGRWHHLQLQYDAHALQQRYKLLVDGILQSQRALAQPLIDPPSPMVVIAPTQATLSLHGWITPDTTAAIPEPTTETTAAVSHQMDTIELQAVDYINSTQRGAAFEEEVRSFPHFNESAAAGNSIFDSKGGDQQEHGGEHGNATNETSKTNVSLAVKMWQYYVMGRTNGTEEDSTEESTDELMDNNNESTDNDGGTNGSTDGTAVKAAERGSPANGAAFLTELA
jgi:hypothetical protein